MKPCLDAPHPLALALLAVVGLVGCATAPEPPSRPTPSGLPEWQLGPQQVVLYDPHQTREHRYLSVRWTPRFPHVLGKSSFTDLVLTLRDPAAGTIELPSEDAELTLARAPEESQVAMGILLSSSEGTLRLHQEEGGLAGTLKAWFVDPLHGGDRYLVLARFAPPAR